MGIVAPQPALAVLAGHKPATGESTPEITAFEIPEGAPTWGYEILDLNLEQELPNVKSFIDRTSALALVAGKRALNDAGLLDREKRPAELDIGCAYGTMMGCLEGMGIFWNKVKTSNPKFAQPLIFTQGYANSPSSLLCIEHGLRGPAATFSGERLSGAEAVLFAFDQIQRGADAMLVCASESLSQAAWNHFYAAGQLSKSGSIADGVVPAEGGVALLLESADGAQRRGARILARISSVQTALRENPAKGAWSHDGKAQSFDAGDLLSAEFPLLVAHSSQTLSTNAEINSPTVGPNSISVQLSKM